MKFFVPFLGFYLLLLSPVYPAFPELPTAAFVQKDGDLRIYFRPKNQILLLPGLEKERFWIKLDCFTVVRNEFWCRIKRIEHLKKSIERHKESKEHKKEKTKMKSPQDLSQKLTNKLESEKKKEQIKLRKKTFVNPVLGQKKAQEEKPMPALLPTFREGTLWIFVIQANSLLLLAEHFRGPLKRTKKLRFLRVGR